MPLDPASAHRAPLAMLYGQTGLFAWTECLRQMGTTSQARVVFIIDQCFSQPEQAFDRAEFALRRRHAPQAAVRELLTWAHQRFGAAPLSIASPPTLAPLSADAEWDAYGALAELMAVELGPQVLRYTRGKLRSKGLALDDGALHDLSALFANVHLRGALCTFDPARGEGHEGAWMGAVFYRYALRHAINTRRMQELTDLLESELCDPSTSPDAVLEHRLQQAALLSLPDLLGALPRVQRMALSLYYGFDSREHTVAEVATALSTNVYFARAALVSGLGALAAATGAQGLLSQDELDLAHAVFLQNRSTEEIAQCRGIEKAALRQHIGTITRKLQSALRRRTVLPRLDLPQREDSMAPLRRSSASASAPIASATQPSAAMHTSDVAAFQGHALSDLASWQEPAADQLLPVKSPQREDLLPDHAEWLQTLEAANARSLSTLAPWLVVYRKLALRQGLEQAATHPDDATLLRSMRDALAAVTAALEEGLPVAARRSNQVQLRLSGLGRQQEPSAQWLAAGWASDPLTFGDLLLHRLGFAGGLSAEVAAVAARSGLQVLAERSSPLLPNFVHQATTALPDGELRLRWVNPLPPAKA